MNRQQRRAGARERAGRAAGGPVGPIAQWFNAALAHHHAGRIAEAERVCRQILVIDPDHAELKRGSLEKRSLTRYRGFESLYLQSGDWRAGRLLVDLKDETAVAWRGL